MDRVGTSVLNSAKILTLLQFVSFAGCLVVFIYLFSMFPSGGNPNLAEEYGTTFLMFGWLVYCIVGSLLSYFTARLLSGLNAILIVGLVFSIFVYGLQFMQANEHFLLIEIVVGLLMLGIAFLLPLLLGWVTGRKQSFRNKGPSYGGK